MVRASSALFLVFGALALSACGGSGDKDIDTLDAELTGKPGKAGDTDPALTAALEDQIMVDPSLSGQANDDAIRPATEPMQTPVPKTSAPMPVPSTKTLGSLAAGQAEVSKDSFNGCGLNVKYSMDYAARLPSDLPLYPQAQVTEAAGSDENGCKLRAVTYTSTAEMRQLAAHYGASATRAGYSVGSKAEGKNQLITGKRAADGGSFYVILTPVTGGTSADFVVNNGI